MATERVEARINTLLSAIDKKGKQLLVSPDNVKVARWEELLKEYKEELKNLNEFGKPTPPTGNPVGVSIGVPTGGSG